MKTQVKNLHNTSDRVPADGSTTWKEYWEKKTGRKFGKCACIECTKPAMVGGHVTKVKGDNSWYITPLCAEHNNYNYANPYWVNDYDLVAVR